MSQHYYDSTGKLFEVDLKEARKLGLVPSVSTIIYEFENSYGLDLYKQKQMFLASMTLPRPKKITDEQFYDLVVEDSKIHSEKAKEFGIKVHASVTMYLKGGVFSKGEFNVKEATAAAKIIEWIVKNKDNCIVDFKTTETKNGKFRQPYDSWLFQLCGYLEGGTYYSDGRNEYIDFGFSTPLWGGTLDYAFITNWQTVKLINLIVSSNEDIPIKVYPWKPEKVEWGTEVFLKMVELYNIMKRI